MQNQTGVLSTGETDTRRQCGRLLLLAACLAALCGMVWLAIQAPINSWLQGGQTLTDWSYVSADTPEGLDQAERQTSSLQDLLSSSRRQAYLELEQMLPASSEDRILTLSYQNAQIAVFWDEQELLNTLDTPTVLTGAQRAELLLPPTRQAGRLRVIWYSPLQLRFSASLRDHSSPAHPADSTVRLALSALSLLLGGWLLWLTVRYRRHPGRRQLLAGGVWGLSLAGALCLDLPVSPSAGPVCFRLQLLCLVGLSVSSLFLLTGREPWSPLMEALLGGALLLGLLMAACPFEPLVCLLIQGYGWWHLACTAAVFYKSYRARRLPLPAPLYVVVLILLLWQGAVWLNALVKCSTGFFWPLPLGGLCLLAALPAAFLHRLRWENQEAKIPAPKAAPAMGSGTLRFTGIEQQETVLRVLTELVMQKCDTDSHHVLHVAEYVRVLCLHSGLSETEAQEIAQASLLHDLGKIVIPSAVLSKEEQLTTEEFEQIQCHVLYGYQILSGTGSPFLQLAADIARQHHEHCDGSGYLGLRGEEICQAASLTAVADVFDALTTDRSYKKAWGFEEGVSYILGHSGDYFDPRAVEAFAAAREQLEKIYLATHRVQPGRLGD